MQHSDIVTIKLFSGQVVPAGASLVSQAVDLGDFAQLGNFSLQLQVAGTGTTVDATYLVANDMQDDFIQPEDASAIVLEFTPVSGVRYNGKDIIPFDVVFARYLRVCIAEISGVTGATVTATLAVQ